MRGDGWTETRKLVEVALAAAPTMTRFGLAASRDARVVAEQAVALEPAFLRHVVRAADWLRPLERVRIPSTRHTTLDYRRAIGVPFSGAVLAAAISLGIAWRAVGDGEAYLGLSLVALRKVMPSSE